MKSLIVDDDITCSAIYKLLLQKYGECDTASCGVAAIDAYVSALDKGEPFDIMVVDIMMPDMNGYEVLQSVRLIEKERNIEFPYNTKIILTTALDDEENKRIGQSLDPTTESYLVKASCPESLVDKLEFFGFYKKEDEPDY